MRQPTVSPVPSEGGKRWPFGKRPIQSGFSFSSAEHILCPHRFQKAGVTSKPREPTAGSNFKSQLLFGCRHEQTGETEDAGVQYEQRGSKEDRRRITFTNE